MTRGTSRDAPKSKRGRQETAGPAIPRQLVEYFLLGQTRRGQPERFCQDGGIVLDVWLEFAKTPEAHQRVLIAPTEGVSTVHMGAALHHALLAYRRGKPKRERPHISPLESYVAATIYLDELLRIVLPLSEWWREKNLAAIHQKAQKGTKIRDSLRRAIEIKLGHQRSDEGELTKLRQQMVDLDDSTTTARRRYPNWKVIDAAPLAALVGLFAEVRRNRRFIPNALKERDLERITSLEAKETQNAFLKWVGSKADEIAKSAIAEIGQPIDPKRFDHARMLHRVEANRSDEEQLPPTLVQRVFLNRSATVAAQPGVSTIKADAATRLFNVSCKDITWAIIDAGIATHHPAFRDQSDGPVPPSSEPDLRRSRVRKTYDFSLIDLIRNFDLVGAFEASPNGGDYVAEIIDRLWALPGRVGVPAVFRKAAVRGLAQIAAQLGNDLQPDWALIEPLILLDGDDGSTLSSDHGTHVAGILAADWRKLAPRRGGQGMEEVIDLQGVCPDLNLYDLRVLAPGSVEATEFAIVAALEFIQYLNQRSNRNRPAVHGVNISMSIPHEVRNYGCGATPVCMASDRLVASGVVLVAAAGNRGWNEEELGFGNFVFCSITDPGNAQQVITVGATHCAKPHLYGVSYFSSRGPTGDGRSKPDLVAPGEKIKGPIRGLANADLDGTSMAAPFVSGAAAMLISRHRELVGNAARVKQILLSTATDLGREKYFQGHGLVDVLRALQSI